MKKAIRIILSSFFMLISLAQTANATIILNGVIRNKDHKSEGTYIDFYNIDDSENKQFPKNHYSYEINGYDLKYHKKTPLNERKYIPFLL